jgi:hypothetical protein
VFYDYPLQPGSYPRALGSFIEKLTEILQRSPFLRNFLSKARQKIMGLNMKRSEAANQQSCQGAFARPDVSR